jgi:hypothetical protein
MSKTPDLDKFIWENPSFPNKTSDDEDILLVVREDLVLILFRFLGLYSVFFLLLLLRSVVVGFSDYLTISIYDSVMYGVGAILTLIFLVIFHTRVCSFWSNKHNIIIIIARRHACGDFDRNLYIHIITYQHGF